MNHTQRTVILNTDALAFCTLAFLEGCAERDIEVVWARAYRARVRAHGTRALRLLAAAILSNDPVADPPAWPRDVPMVMPVSGIELASTAQPCAKPGHRGDRS